MKQVSTDLTKVLKGLNVVCDTVGSTLGPKGRNVALSDPSGAAHEITNDGVFIASQIMFEDREEDFGAYLARNTSAATNDEAGDGTTGTTVLLQAIIKEALKRPEDPMTVRQSLFDARDEIVKEVKKIATPIKTDEQIKQVATISAESEKYGQMITDIIKKVGREGTITVEDSRTFETDYEVVDGYKAYVGFMSPYFVTDKNKASVEYQKVLVAVFQHKISSVSDIKYLGDLLQANKIDKIVLVVSDIDTVMLNNFIANNITPGGLKNVVIRAGHIDLLKDIAAAVGATVIGGETGVSHEQIQAEHLGLADRVVITEKTSLFFRKECKTKLVEAKRLEELAKGNSNEYEKAKYLERAAKLKGEIAVIRVGAKTDMEKRYLKKKLEDAVNATQSALEEGIVEGGGMTLYRMALRFAGEETVGQAILTKALKAPLRKIIENAGKDYADIIKNLKKDEGYDAKNDSYGNLVKQGIIDPAKVIRCMVENAIGTAGTFVTMSSIVTEIPKNEPK